MKVIIATVFYVAFVLLVLIPMHAFPQEAKKATEHGQPTELEGGFREYKAVTPSTKRPVHTVLFPQEREVGSRFFIEGIFETIRLVYSCERRGDQCVPPVLQAMNDHDFGRSLVLVFPEGTERIVVGVVYSQNDGRKDKMASGVFFTPFKPPAKRPPTRPTPGDDTAKQHTASRRGGRLPVLQHSGLS